jgi:AraC family transcriptional regulator, regulatory protein of adaptative response / methylated-DNA-[protein]-cysteine methyltransferase
MRPADTITLTPATVAPAHLSVHHAASPFGPIFMAATAQGLCHLWLDAAGTARAELQALYPQAQITEQASPHHAAALSHFTDAPQSLSLHLKGTPFQLSVWRALLDIPLGRASSYKTIATQIGKPKANRAVGSAVGKNPVFFVIPCHRVLAHDGKLGGYFYGLEKKQQILNWEAVQA